MKNLLLIVLLALVSAAANAIPVGGRVVFQLGTYGNCLSYPDTGFLSGTATLSAQTHCDWNADQSGWGSASPGELHGIVTASSSTPPSGHGMGAGVSLATVSYRDSLTVVSAPGITQANIRVTAYLHASFDTVGTTACTDGSAGLDTPFGIGVFGTNSCNPGTFSRQVDTWMVTNTPIDFGQTLYLSAYAHRPVSSMEVDASNSAWMTFEALTADVDLVFASGHDYSVAPPPGSSVPEPGTLWIAALGLAGLFGARRARA